MSLDIHKKPRTEEDWNKFWDLYSRLTTEYPGTTERQDALARFYGVAGRTVRRWMEAHPLEVKVYHKADEFLQIPFVKKWWEELQLEEITDDRKRDVLSHVRKSWKFLERKDPRLWTTRDMKALIKSWRGMGLKEATIQKYKSLLRKFLDGVSRTIMPQAFDLAKVLAPGKMAKRGGAEVYHEPLTIEQFFDVLVPNMSKASRQYVEKRLDRFPTAEYVDEMTNTIIHFAAFSGARTGNLKTGKDTLGIRVLRRPDEPLVAVMTPKGIKTGSYVLYMNGEIQKWDILGKWNASWRRILFPGFVEKKIIDWIEHAHLGHGDPLFPIAARDYRAIIKMVRPLCNFPFMYYHHNLRSTSLCWRANSGIPLEIAIDIGVGWLTIETAKEFYLKWGKRRHEDEIKKLFSLIEAKAPLPPRVEG